MRLRVLAFAVLSACGPAPQEEPGLGALPVDVTPGWNEVEPDTCKLEEFTAYLGQTAAEVEAAGIARLYRVIAPGAIISQEYAPGRVNFWLNRRGEVERIVCG